VVHAFADALDQPLTFFNSRFGQSLQSKAAGM
jgi:hypothetical protein